MPPPLGDGKGVEQDESWCRPCGTRPVTDLQAEYNPLSTAHPDCNVLAWMQVSVGDSFKCISQCSSGPVTASSMVLQGDHQT